MPRLTSKVSKRWSPDFVWVVIYDHEYGTDVNLYRSEKSAWMAVGEILGSNVHDLPDDVALKVVALLGKGDVKRALSLWRDSGPGEELYVERHEVED